MRQGTYKHWPCTLLAVEASWDISSEGQGWSRGRSTVVSLAASGVT